MYLKRQEVIEFDPSNKAHRAAARAFLRRKAWVDSPLRFAHDTGYGSVAEQIQAKLLDWYVAQEEAKETKKPTQLRARIENSRVIQSSGSLEFLDETNAMVPFKLQKMTTDVLLGQPVME